MTTTGSHRLDSLRRQIDEIDDRLHELIMRRAEIVTTVANVKADEHIGAYRPDRAAQILRRIVGSHRGPFPRPALVRLWCEMLGGTVAMQTEFTIAVADGGWDLARDHFGTLAPLIDASDDEAMLAVSEGRASIAVLPLPADGLPEPWWLTLAETAEKRLHVILRLPFGALGNADPMCSDAFVVAPFEPEPSGDDCTLLAIIAATPVRLAALTDAFLAVDLHCNPVASALRAGGAALLVEADAALRPDDRRIAAALARLGAGVRAEWLGLYARPLPDAVLGGVAPE
jgi:chorismate mutase / prephenate dehydratase